MTTKKSKPKAVTSDYAMNEQEQDVVNKTSARRKADKTPRVKITNDRVSNYHPKEGVGLMLMMEAIGTTDADFFEVMMAQLANAAMSQGHPPVRLSSTSCFQF